MSSKLKFLLINPTATQWRVSSSKKPRRKTKIFRFSMLSSLYVAAAMPPGVETQILDEEVEAINYDTDADLIGISFMTFNAPRAYEIADKFRYEKGKPVIVGGYHPTFMSEEAIQHADAVCIGEAETSIPQIITDYMTNNLKSFYHSEPADLGKLAIPNRKLLKKNFYITADTIQATRGCPHACKFCSISTFFKQNYRTRPIEQVIEELKLLGKYILFMDDDIIVDPEHAKELFIKMIPLAKRWFSQCNVKIAYDDELLNLAQRSGCRGIFIGFESIEQKNLRSWQKNINKASDYQWIVQKLHNKGIGVCAGIVFGNDNDSPKIFSKTLDFLEKIQVDALQATILTPFPGTLLYKEFDQQKRIFDKDWSKYNFCNVVFEPSNLSRRTLKNGHDWVLNSFYSNKSLLKRFSHEFRYLNPSTIFRATIPLNLSYKARLKGYGNIDMEQG